MEFTKSNEMIVQETTIHPNKLYGKNNNENISEH
jgi:hypothetical protein